MQNVSNHGAGRRGDHADHPRQKGQGTLALGVEQALGGEALAALVEQRHQRADARRLERLYDDLIGGFAGKGRELAGRDDLHALLGLDLEARESALPDHRVEPRASRPSSEK